MNGSLQADDEPSKAPPAVIGGEELRNLLRNTSRDAKIIFGASRGVFDLNRSKIENFFHLIDQRVREQNTAITSTCEFVVYYNDGTSRKFPSVPDFQSYAETRARHPTVVTIHLVYLLRFHDVPTAERQEIDIVIRTSDMTHETLQMVADDSQLRMSGDKIQFMVGNDEASFGVITYTINNSRISWGLDLEGHIKSHIDSVMDPPTTADKFLARSAGPLNIFTTVFVGLYCVNLIIDIFFTFLYSSDDSSATSDVLQIAADYVVNGQIAKYIVASLVVAVVFFALFSGLVSVLTKSMRKPRPSFVVLDENDERYRWWRNKQHSRRWTRFSTVIILDLFVAILVIFLEQRITTIFFSN